MVDEEKAGGIIFSLHCGQSRIIGTPKRLLPRVFEKITLRDVRTRLGGNLSQFVHRLTDRAGMSACGLCIWLMAGDARKARWTAGGDYGQRKRVQNGWIGGSVPGGLQLFGRRPGQALIEMQGHTQDTPQCRLLAKSASTRRACWSSFNNKAGSQADL